MFRVHSPSERLVAGFRLMPAASRTRRRKPKGEGVEQSRIDATARLLAGATSRRTLLAPLAALATVFLGHDAPAAEAARRGRKKRRKRSKLPRRPPCAETCRGCCLGETCIIETTDQRCGFDGATCAPCASNAFCLSGICRMIV